MGLNKLDLTETIWPYCLLECNKAVDELSGDEELEVLVDDADVFKQICMLVQKTFRRSYTAKIDNGVYHILIRIL